MSYPISNSVNNDRPASSSESKSNVEHLEKAGADDTSVQHDRDLRRFDTEAERKLVRKLDMRIMPALWAMYFLNYLDRSTIAQARLNGLEKHLGLVGSQFNVCVSILFVGYTVVQVSLFTDCLDETTINELFSTFRFLPTC